MIVAGICPHHGYWSGEICPKCETDRQEVFFTSKDKKWEFIDHNLTGKPIQITSRGQWNKLLKEHKKHDDVSVKDMGIIKKNYDNNLHDKQKRELRKTVEEVYSEVKRR